MSTNTDDVEKRTGTVQNFRSVTVTPERVQAYIEKQRADDLDEGSLSLHESAGGVTLATEAVDTDAEQAAGSLVELDADRARLLADALYQAAAEMDGGDA